MKEIWKDIEGYDDYQISNCGRLKSYKGKTERILKESISRGYIMYSIWKDNKMKNLKSHILVWEHFGSSERCDLHIDHIDHNKTNNHIDNLQLLSPRYNTIKHHNRKGNLLGSSFKKSNKKWQSQIYSNGKKNYLGLFDTELEAHNVYKDALQKINIKR